MIRTVIGEQENASMTDGPPPNTRVATEDGETVVYVTHKTADGEMVIKHAFPSAILNHYQPAGIGEDIPLYAGTFQLASQLPTSFIGDVRFTWNPTPRVMARGGANRSMLDDILDGDDGPKWVRMGDVIVDTINGIPTPPSTANSSWNRDEANTWMEDRIATPSLGDGEDLDSVTFFVPNGWQSIGGSRIQDGARPWIWWDGGLTSTAAEWQVTIHPTGRHSSEFWSELKSSGSSQVTHIGRLTRIDGARFSADAAENPLNAIRLAISFALGRAVQCLLPVGWQDSIPVWTMWHTGGIDRVKGVQSLLDQTIAPSQLEEMIGQCLVFAADPFKEEVLQYSVSYYLTANYDVNVELAVALPISALQLLAYYRFVEDRGTFSRGRWNDLTTGEQIRELLSDCSIDLEIPVDFQHLESVRTTLGLKQDGSPRDALDCIIKMRNNVIHPTRDKPATWDPYQWSEASQVVLDYLRLAILNLVGFNSSIRTAVQPSKHLGQTAKVPWAP